MVLINGIRIRFAEAALVNSVFINVQAKILYGNRGPLSKHGQYFLSIENYQKFILNPYQEVGQKPELTGTPKNCDRHFNPLLGNKTLAQSKIKVFANDRLKATQNIKSILHRVKNIVGKRRKCLSKAFSPLPEIFSKFFSSDVKQHLVW